MLQWPMPKVAQEGEFAFHVRSREFEFEAPHVHVVGPDDLEVRINLEDGSFMDAVPQGKTKKIREAYVKHIEKIREVWDEYHPARKRRYRR